MWLFVLFAESWEIRDLDLFEPLDAESVVVAEDGALYVAHRYDLCVLLYDSRGNRIKTFGRKGSGPGEFKALYQVALIDDKIYTNDHGHRRVITWTRDGEYLSDVTAPTPFWRLCPIKNGYLADVSDFQNNERKLVVTDEGLNELKTLATWSFARSKHSASKIHFNPAINMGSVLVSPDGTSVYYAPPGRLEVHRYQVAMETDTVIYSEEVERIPFDEDWGDELMARMKAPGINVVPDYPDYFPAYSALTYSATGHLFITYWSMLKDPTGGRFLDLDGTPVDMKEDYRKLFQILWCNDRRAIVQYTDESDESLVLASIPKQELNAFRATHKLFVGDE